MTDSLIDELDLAWRRSMNDAGKRGFFTHPHLITWVESDREAWLTHLASKIGDDYAPQSAYPCFVPKPHYMLRPGAVLVPEDEVVYNWLVGRMMSAIWDRLKWSQDGPDSAYLLRSDSVKAVDWVRGGTTAFRRFREKSLSLMTGSVSQVVDSDISGFYGNIDIRRLESDLRSLGAPADEVTLLKRCLRRWSGSRGRGIPQGYTASDILAKVYFDPIDRALKNRDIEHLRYVDDLRLFCGSKRQAKRAVYELTALVHARGLSLQSAKTEILSKPDAIAKFKGVVQVIEDIGDELKEELAVLADSEYAAVKEVFKALSNTHVPPPEVLECAFRDNFLDAAPDRFDKSLFHFLLYRLSAAKSPVAVEYCLSNLNSRPEESASILAYLAEIDLSASHIDTMVAYIGSDDAIWDYQLYQLIKWFCDSEREDPRILDRARKWAFDQNRELWLRVYCMHYLEKHGEDVDLEQVENHYQQASTDLEKASCVAAVFRMELTRRNAFLAAVKADGIFVRRAVQVVKARAH